MLNGENSKFYKCFITMILKKQYIKPIIEFDIIESDNSLLVNSQPNTQCHCYEYEVHGGCRGCTGGCGCNHWDSELGELIPGC